MKRRKTGVAQRQGASMAQPGYGGGPRGGVAGGGYAPSTGPSGVVASTPEGSGYNPLAMQYAGGTVSGTTLGPEGTTTTQTPGLTYVGAPDFGEDN